MLVSMDLISLSCLWKASGSGALLDPEGAAPNLHVWTDAKQ